MPSSNFAIAGAAALLMSLASAQTIDIAGVQAAGSPAIVTPPLATATQTATVAASAAESAAAAASVSAGLTGRRLRSLNKRDGDCSVQATGAGPVPSPDTAQGFLDDQDIQNLAIDAPTPYGYDLVFSNLDASLSACNYMGLYTLNSYDTYACQEHCDAASGCVAFNIYAERDPSLDPNADSCPNPPSTTNFGCTLWGAPVSESEATNSGQWRDSFQVVITASNAYNKNLPPPAIDGYEGPTELAGAINAPDYNGYNTYIGYDYFPFSQSQGYDPTVCAASCNEHTEYSEAHPDNAGNVMPCNFFVAYMLSLNGVPQGLYCSQYNYTWSDSYATNLGQYGGSGDRYTVSDAYSYSLDTQLSDLPFGGS